ncbi:hypothetical protein DEAC_c36400 [Desulfosporosinus acididurans]|uniref:Uncharacterized protein n=1 Tax=Desulfosporosinus acididurans TaxID=476652 RepID=A0A0J1FNA6_9FIRM|nr:hypothetical protein [Desulfosporosinus acididurans]KLU64438.1 hypothetical protein DEAC_c36400 [Desulfosporosinus acididurans]
MTRKETCWNCDVKLSEPYLKVHYCNNCAQKERVKIKKYFQDSLIAGLIFTFIIFCIISFIKIKFVPSDTDYVVFNTAFIIDANRFLSFITNLSIMSQAIIYLICFVIPFGHYINLKINVKGFAGLGVILVELIISVISAPIVVVYQLYKMLNLSKVLKPVVNEHSHQL